MSYLPDIKMPDIEQNIIDSVVNTGLYFRPLLHCWQIWLVEKSGRKEVVGYCDESEGVEAAKDLWDEFAYIVQNEVESVYELEEEQYVH